MRNLILFLATGFGSGYSKYAPGTFGSLVGLVIAWFTEFKSGYLLLAILLGIVVSHMAEVFLQEKDSPRIVIDEIVGMLIAAIHVPNSWLPLAFILFRVFDIRKPFFIGRLQYLHGGYGVMADDVAAGIVANILTLLIMSWLS